MPWVHRPWAALEAAAEGRVTLLKGVRQAEVFQDRRPVSSRMTPGMDMGQALWQVLEEVLVTLLSGGASTGGSVTPERAALQSTGRPCSPADHALVALFAPSAARGPLAACSSLICLRCEAKLCSVMVFTQHLKTVGQNIPAHSWAGHVCLVFLAGG